MEKNDHNSDAWELHFNPFNQGDDIVLIMAQANEDKNYWNYASKLLKVDDDSFEAIDLDEAKWLAEDMILDYFEDKLNYYHDIINEWEG